MPLRCISPICTIGSINPPMQERGGGCWQAQSGSHGVAELGNFLLMEASL